MSLDLTQYLIPFLFAALLLAFLPGPSILYVLARTLDGGREAGIASTIGTAVGGLVHVSIAALGLSALLTNSSAVFGLVKFVGALYLMYLGLRTLLDTNSTSTYTRAARSSRKIVYEGFITEILNIKVALFFMAFLPQFIDPASAPGPQLIMLGCICVILNGLADLTVVFFATRLAPLTDASSQSAKRLSYGSGAVLLLLGLYTALVDFRN